MSQGTIVSRTRPCRGRGARTSLVWPVLYCLTTSGRAHQKDLVEGGGYARFVVAYVLSSHSVVVSSVTRGLLRVNGMAMVLVTVQAEPVVRDGRPCLG